MNSNGKFLGFNSNYDDSSVVFMGIPFDGTASFRPGSRFAPESVRSYSHHLETYSPYQDQDIEDISVFDAGDLIIPLGNTKNTLSLIETKTTEILSDGKKIFACGGEHLISYPIVKAYVNRYPNLHVIHIDAHTDLREQYRGEKLSHASVIKLVSQKVNPKKIYQYGIRSGEKEEFVWGRQNTNFFPYSLAKLKNINIAKTTPVYLTLDVDVLDPAYLPGTGTPEPGGVTFNELLEALLSLNGFNIVGADIVELAPDYDSSGASTKATSKLIREIVLLLSN